MPITTLADSNPIKLCVVIVGLPARGKSFISQKIVRYLSWLSIPTKSFNCSTNLIQQLKESNTTANQLFNKENTPNHEILNKTRQLTLDQILKWFTEIDNCGVAIYDGINATKFERDHINKTLSDNNINTVFLESYCDDQSIIDVNITDIESTSPEYFNSVSLQDTINSVSNKIQFYDNVYETLTASEESNLSFIKLINFSSQIILNHIDSYLKSRIVYYIMNLHVKNRYIWLSRHGESQYNLEGKIGGDAALSERGIKYSHKLVEIVDKYIPNHDRLEVWTSTLKRTQQTAKYLPFPKKQWKALDELDAGSCDGLTYDEIAEKFPEDFKARDDNKFEYRYPGGESYRDVITRLEPIIMALENQENVLVITHQAVLRCIYAYFMNVHQEESPWMSIPLHTLIRLEIKAYGTEVTRIKADIPAVSTYKEKGTSKLGESNNSLNIMSGSVISGITDKIVN
ncbi:Fructose-2,6-bisphosphatase [Pichia californica]|uniref:fructose-2,6-bisphosphate 2-phosphatase n=1 Tax=Pichia californica TaxID=460514 RepID=A0A9P7BFM8_9ASCO|nr:Fructose-2,6-bisphosphatase [[Candida] californica]